MIAKRFLALGVVAFLTAVGFSCRYVMPERFVDYSKGRVPVNLPRDVANADIDRNVEKDSAVIVTVGSDGKMYIGKDHSPIDHDTLRYKVRELAANLREDHRIVYLAADVAADYGKVTEACDAIRGADVSHVGVLAFTPKYDWPGRMVVELPAVPDPNQDLSQFKPNPLTLVVTISPDLKVKLNGDDYGSSNDLGGLNDKLIHVFQLRREQHAYRQGYETRTDLPEDERVEKTITIKADRKNKFGDVAKVINTLIGAGARPIFLQLDDLVN
jgi:biopolymer transport protein ExbD/biopolymer transport protein TolR